MTTEELEQKLLEASDKQSIVKCEKFNCYATKHIKVESFISSEFSPLVWNEVKRLLANNKLENDKAAQYLNENINSNGFYIYHHFQPLYRHTTPPLDSGMCKSELKFFTDLNNELSFSGYLHIYTPYFDVYSIGMDNGRRYLFYEEQKDIKPFYFDGWIIRFN